MNIYGIVSKIRDWIKGGTPEELEYDKRERLWRFRKEIENYKKKIGNEKNGHERQS